MDSDSPKTVTVFCMRQYSRIYWTSSDEDGRNLGLGVKHLFIRPSRNYEYGVASGRKNCVFIEDSRLSKGCFLKHSMNIAHPSANTSTFVPISNPEYRSNCSGDL